uniref:Uncharacterized protein n=1 Tax=Arundo donax TaxID=35708 RepID=A0A0A9AG85_ARUDO
MLWVLIVHIGLFIILQRMLLLMYLGYVALLTNRII